jgi:hypothetical protein
MAGAVAIETKRFCGERPGFPRRVSRRRRSCGFPLRKFAHGGKEEGGSRRSLKPADNLAFVQDILRTSLADQVRIRLPRPALAGVAIQGCRSRTGAVAVMGSGPGSPLRAAVCTRRCRNSASVRPKARSTPIPAIQAVRRVAGPSSVKVRGERAHLVLEPDRGRHRGVDGRARIGHGPGSRFARWPTSSDAIVIAALYISERQSLMERG